MTRRDRTNAGKPPHVVYAVAQLRKLGRELVAGSWSRGAKPMTVPEALATMAEAVAVVLDTGAMAVVGELHGRLRELASRLVDNGEE